MSRRPNRTTLREEEDWFLPTSPTHRAALLDLPAGPGEAEPHGYEGSVWRWPHGQFY
jgi:hypothetical protein